MFIDDCCSSMAMLQSRKGMVNIAAWAVDNWMSGVEINRAKQLYIAYENTVKDEYYLYSAWLRQRCDVNY